MRIRLTALSVLYAAIANFCAAQSVPTVPEDHRIIIKYFPGFQLENIASDDPDLYTQLQAYFAESFVVEYVDCKDCDVDYNELLNVDLFDVAQFEGFRASAERIQLNFKTEKYRIFLLSEQELTTLFGGVSVEETFSKTFPKWVDSGDLDFDYNAYKKSVAYWATLFPELYRTLTSSSTILKIRFAEFSQMSPAKRNSLFTNPNGYYITD